MDKIPTFEAYNMHGASVSSVYNFEVMDHTESIESIKSVVKNCFSALYQFDATPTKEQFDQKLKYLLLNYGMWWSSNFERDISRLIAHTDGYPEVLTNLESATNVVSLFLHTEYKQDSPRDESTDPDSSIFSAEDIDIIVNPDLNKSEKIRKLMDRYKPKEIADAIGTSPQVVRNVRKAARKSQ